MLLDPNEFILMVRGIKADESDLFYLGIPFAPTDNEEGVKNAILDFKKKNSTGTGRPIPKKFIIKSIGHGNKGHKPYESTKTLSAQGAQKYYTLVIKEK